MKISVAGDRPSLTESEWPTCAQPETMLGHLQGKISQRKLLLFACACARRLWPALPDERNRHAVEVAERFAEGMANRKELNRAADQSWAAMEEAGGGTSWLVDALSGVIIARGKETEEEAGRRAALLRDVAGDPFHEVLIEPAWRTPGLVAMAQEIYDQGAFQRLPELADALEALGCHDQDLLAHCRSQAEHVRGCWVLDAILDKK